MGHTHQAGKPNISLAALQASDLRRMKIAGGGKVFLSQPVLFAAGSYVLAELFLGRWIGLTAAACRSRLHARMLDPPSRELQSKLL
jgi:hypothetical protein